MAKYYYERYKVDTNYSNYYLVRTPASPKTSLKQVDLSLEWRMEPTNGTIQGYGQQTTVYSYESGKSGLVFEGGGLAYEYIAVSYDEGFNRNALTSKRDTIYSKGAYVDTLIAENGTYPTNGKQGDYWYIRKDIVNTAPSMPGAFTQPTGELETDDPKVFSVGSSSDAEGNLSKYVWEASIDGGSYSKIGETPTNNITYTIPSAKTLKIRVKAVDSQGLESGWRESAVFTVIKPKYYWSKYNVNRSYGEFPSTAPVTGRNSTQNISGNGWSDKLYSGYGYSSSRGFVGMNSSYYPTKDSPPKVGWFLIYNSDPYSYCMEITSVPSFTESGVVYKNCSVFLREVVKPTYYSQGSLIQSGIIAEEGTYPTNGQQAGYWWVRGSLVNQSIAPPGAFTAPAAGTVFKPSERITVTGGNSTAPNLSRYIIDASYDNWATFENVNNVIQNSTVYVVPTDKTKTKVQFRSRAQNTSNVYSDYVYSDIYVIQHNVIPTILLNTANNFIMSETEGQNEVLVEGSAIDTDANNNVIVKMQINDGTIRNIQSAISDGSTPIEFSKKITYSNKRVYDGATPLTNDLPEDIDHKLKVWADDGQGGISTVEERTFRVIHNRPPVISGTDEDLGDLLETPSITYQVDDPEKQSSTITERINGQVIRTFDAELGTEYKLEIPIEMWIPLQIDQKHFITIESVDSFGAKSIRTYTFTRTEDTILVELKNPFVTDIAATRLLVTPDVYLPIGSTIVIEACNNAFDEIPTWEDITGMAMNKRGFNFENTEKTAEQWGINIRFTIYKGTAHDQVRFNGFGGAFD